MDHPPITRPAGLASSRPRITVAAIVLGGAALALAAREAAVRRRVHAGEPFARVRHSVSIAAPADAAYGVLADAQAIGRLSPDVIASAHSPNRWHWDFALPAGLSATVETVMTDARPGRRLALRSVHGSSIPFEAEFDLFPAADSGETVVTAVVTFGSPRLLPAALVEGPLRRAADRAITGLLGGLATVLHAGSTPPGAGQPGTVDGEPGADHGLGRVVYGRPARPVASEPDPPADLDDAVEEALEESFPASDAPGFATGTTMSLDPDRLPAGEA